MISCATPAETWPRIDSRLAWASSSRSRRDPGLGRLALGDLGGERGVRAVELLGAPRDAPLELDVHRRERGLARERPAPAAQHREADRRDQQAREQRRQPARSRAAVASAGSAGRNSAERQPGAEAPTGALATTCGCPSIRASPAVPDADRHRRQRRSPSCSAARAAASSPSGRVVPKRHVGSVVASTTPASSVTTTDEPALAPARLEAVELDLDHDDAERPERAVDAARQVEPGPAADGAERVLLRRALGHRPREIGAEAVVAADEAAGGAGVAGGDGEAVAVDDVDDRRVGLGGDVGELGVEQVAGLSAGAASSAITSGSRASTIGISRCFSITAASEAVASGSAAAARSARSAAARSRATRPAANAAARISAEHRQRDRSGPARRRRCRTPAPPAMPHPCCATLSSRRRMLVRIVAR